MLWSQMVFFMLPGPFPKLTPHFPVDSYTSGIPKSDEKLLTFIFVIKTYPHYICEFEFLSLWCVLGTTLCDTIYVY